MSAAASKNAVTAAAGFKAEKLLCENAAAAAALTTYYGKPIARIEALPGRKKSDVRVVFADGVHRNIQIKDGKGNTRGWSADRRPLDKYDPSTAPLLAAVCLHTAADRPIVPRPPSLIADLLLGGDVATRPDDFVHTEFDRGTGDLLHMSICSADTIIAALNTAAYENLVPKRTCVHISPHLYLQRKGGGSKDSRPNDIQLKIKAFPDGLMQTLC